MRGRCGAVKPDVGGTEPVRGFVRQGTDDPGSGIESELRCCVRIRPGGGPWQGHRNGLRLPAVGLRRGTVEVGGERDVHEVVPQQFGSDDQALLRRQHAAVEAGLDEGQRAECGHTLRPCDGTQDPVVAPEDEAVLLGVVDSRQPCRAAPPPEGPGRLRSSGRDTRGADCMISTRRAAVDRNAASSSGVEIKTAALVLRSSQATVISDRSAIDSLAYSASARS